MKFLSFFHMRENPFGETPDVKFYYPSQAHEAAMQKICWSIEENKSFVLVSAEVGAGKTMLSRMLHYFYASEAKIAMVVNPSTNNDLLLNSICQDFGISSDQASIEKLNEFLVDSANKEKRNILIIDEAQTLTDKNLEFVRLLTNLETSKRKLLQVVLIAQPEIESRLQQASLRQLYQRIFLKVNLPYLSELETQKYIRHRLEVSGGSKFVRFDNEAISKIHAISKGAPRVINKICELALCFAAIENKRHIDKQWIKNLPLEEIGIKPVRFSFFKHFGARP